MSSCPINKAYILYAEEILGPNLGSLKGKAKRTAPSNVLINALNDVPTDLLEHQKMSH